MKEGRAEMKGSHKSYPTISEGQDCHTVKGEKKNLKKSYLTETFFGKFIGTPVFMIY